MGRNREALPYYERALSLRRGTSSEGHVLGNLALVHLGLGETNRALQLYDDAIALAHQQGARVEEADWRKGKGSALQHVGRYDAAQAEYRQALAIYDAAGVRQKKVELLQDSGYLHLALGDYEEAQRGFAEALALASAIHDQRDVIITQLALGDLEWRRKRVAESLKRYHAALEPARQIGDRASTASALVQIALVSQTQKLYADASRRGSEARDIAQETGAKLLEAEALYALGESARLQRQFENALADYRAAEAITAEAGETELGWRVAFGAGQALHSMGRPAEAIDACRRAVTTIESVRERLREERFQAGYIEDKYEVYVFLVRLLLDQKRLAEAFTYAERLHARSYAELVGHGHPRTESAEELELRERIRQLQQALERENGRPREERRSDAVEAFSRDLEEAERRYSNLLDDLRASDPRYAAAGSLATPRLDAVQRCLPADTALIEYLVAPDRVLAFLVRDRYVRSQQVLLGAKNLAAKVGLMRDLIGRPPGDEWRKPAESLAQLLIMPLARNGWLAGVRRLYVVPHQVLHYLPFGALPDGTRLLADDYAIAYLPSAATLVQPAAATAAAAVRKPLLALAPSQTGLKYTEGEVRALEQFFRGPSLVLTGGRATEWAFKSEAPGYEVIHVATHASFNALNPMLSAVELEPGHGEDGKLQVREILDLHLNARLVTLSACATALASGYFADVPAGDDFVGLTRAFLYAGSQSVLASLWEVDDLSTSMLMRDFYGRLGKADTARALKAAQESLRRKDPKYQHPYYWAPFIFVGKMD